MKFHPLSISVAVGAWVVVAELFCIWTDPVWPSVALKIPDASGELRIEHEVILDRSRYTLFLELDFGGPCDRGGSPLLSIDGTSKQMHMCGGIDRSAPIRITWSISELASRNRLFGDEVQTTVSNRVVRDKWSRVAGTLRPTPGKYWFEATIQNESSQLTGLPAQLLFWSRSRTSADFFTYFVRLINWFVLGPIALLVSVVFLIRYAMRQASMLR